MAIIRIPQVNREERIGSVFNDLFRVINSTEADNDPKTIWDFGGTSFFHPFFLAPLSIYKNKCGKRIVCTNQSQSLSSYMTTINFDGMKTFERGDDLENTLIPYSNKSYTPICKFSIQDERMVDALQSVVQRIIKNQSHYDDKINNPLSYLLSEIICNISQHSLSDYGYLYSQYLRREGVIDLCIADNGITIFGSYVKTKRYLDKVGDNEAEALRLANNGFSTKKLPETRGFGLSTTRRMLVEGMKGAFFELSGGAFYRYENIKENYVLLPKPLYWEGTIILMRIPVNVDNHFDFYKYIE
jgi:anti-sigma regulatory factor (Ser/Thr protein kinase)